MGNTTIEWTDKTWNPWHGCRKVSPGCAHCYMYAAKTRYGQEPRTVVRSKTTWDDPIKKWREPARIFTCSWSDFFIEEADGWRDEAWAVIRRTPWHTYQVLTKRPERLREHVPWVRSGEAPWSHVWLGVSVETQRYADERIPWLLGVPAVVLFLSVEPLLGPVDLDPYLAGLGWVIVGGESGPGHRPMDLAWARGVRDQCVASAVPLFFKQGAGRRRRREGRCSMGASGASSPMANLLALAESFLAWADHFGVALYPWQREAFGGAARREGGRFVYRLAGISVPRGNGKSWAAAALGAWRFQCGPQPQLVLSAALDFEGAKVVQAHARTILRAHPELRRGVEFRADEIRMRSTDSRWIVRSREHTALRGLHPDVILYDEVGWARDDELFSSLLAAQASVADPLLLVVSTVGRRRTGPLWQIKTLAEQGEEAPA